MMSREHISASFRVANLSPLHHPALKRLDIISQRLPAQPSPGLVPVHRIKIEALSVVVNFIGEGIMAHMVYCVKFKKEMPGLDEPPFDNELGQKVYDNVSQEAWRMWMEHCKMLLNEYRLNPARREDQEVIVKQLEMFFFGEGSAKPKEYVPPTT